MNDLEQWRKELQQYYNQKYFMESPNNWQELANAAVERDYQAEVQKRNKSNTLPEVTVTAKGNSKPVNVAVESDLTPSELKTLSTPDKARAHYNDYLGRKYAKDAQHAANVVGGILALPAAGTAAAPVIGSGIAAGLSGYATFQATHPLLATGIDVALTADGVRNALSNNGVQKTYRLAKEGKYGRAALSGAGDMLDFAGGVGLVYKGLNKGVSAGRNVYNAGKKWLYNTDSRFLRPLREYGLKYTKEADILSYNPNLQRDKIKLLQSTERSLPKGFKLSHPNELSPVFEVGLQTPQGKAAYPNGVEVWYRGLSRGKGKAIQAGDDAVKSWDQNVANGQYKSLFFGDYNTAHSYIQGQSHPLEYSRITGREFPNGDDSKLLQFVYPKGTEVSYDVKGSIWHDLDGVTPWWKPEEVTKQYQGTIDAYVKAINESDELSRELRNRNLLHITRNSPEWNYLDDNAKASLERFWGLGPIKRQLEKELRPYDISQKIRHGSASTKDIEEAMRYFPLPQNKTAVVLRNIIDFGPKGVFGSKPTGIIRIQKLTPGQYGKSAIASDLDFDLTNPSIWKFGGKLNYLKFFK